MRRLTEKKPVMVQAADLLARQEHSSRKLKEKLIRRGYTEEETDTAIDKLKAAHYLNDDDACHRAFEYFYNEKRLSVRQICQKLMQRGFEREMIEANIPEDTAEREAETAKKVLRLKFHKAVPWEKQQQYLYTRGFDGSARREAIESFMEEMNDE